MITTILIIVFWFILGTIMGSFGGVLLDRWDNLRSMLLGRSICMSCKHPLAAKDLIPLVSYLSTWGTCRYCSAPIPVSCPITELIMGAVFACTTRWVLATWFEPIAVHLIAWWLINRSLTLMIIHDHNTHYLHWTAWIIAVITVIWYTIGRHQDLLFTTIRSSIILGSVFLVIYACGWLIHKIKYGDRAEWFGLGDVLTALLIGWLTPLVLWYDILNTIGEAGTLVFVQLLLGYLVISSAIWLLYWWFLWGHGDQEIEIAFLPGMIVWFWIYMITIVGFGLFL